MKYGKLVLLVSIVVVGCSGVSGPGVAIVDVESGNSIAVKMPFSGIEEFVLLTDDSAERLVTMCVKSRGVALRFISYDGSVERTLSLDVPDFGSPRVSAGVALSPDATTLVFYDTYRGGVFEIDLSSGATTTLLDNVDWMLEGMYWTFDGAVVAIVVDPLARESSGSIVRIDREQKEKEVIHRAAGFGMGLGTSILSPDRRYLLLVEDVPDIIGDRLQLLDLETREAQTVIEPSEGTFFRDPCWSADQTTIAYESATRHAFTPEEREEQGRTFSEKLKIETADPQALQSLASQIGAQFKVVSTIFRCSVAERSPSPVTKPDRDVDSTALALLTNDCVAIATGGMKMTEGPIMVDEHGAAKEPPFERKQGTILLVEGDTVRELPLGDVSFYTMIPVAGGTKLICTGSAG